jgi:predicted  nucleic acid-binding Zn-ribbon protein
MNETVEISKLRGEISILKEELQRIKIVAEQEKSRANWNYEQYNDLQQELEKTKEQRDELDREITSLHAKYFQQRVEKDREQYASNTRAHFERSSRIDAILAEREKTHGSFSVHANCTQILEDTFYSFRDKHCFTAVMQEGLHMIFHKLGRIAAGCAMHKDHWDDIAGYATLVSRSMENLEKE